MPEISVTATLPYEEGTNETSILLARRYLVDAIEDAFDCDDIAYLAALASDFGIKDPEHSVIEEAEHILLGGHWDDHVDFPLQDQLFGAEAWA